MILRAVISFLAVYFMLLWLTTGYLFNSGGGVISWSSKKPAVVALSTSEAEFIALSAAPPAMP